ncbi:signal recognition particle-docking protein FtsY [Sulfitobacter sp.]|uniref:signal recognition particle-docking protein FtsY n=1 Tax=Sulfitobacter sp. TaxID=1903071 RepID=UPI003EF75FAD
MAFFKKLKDKLFKSSSKIDEGLEAIVSDGGQAEPAALEAPQVDEAALQREADAVAEAAAREEQRIAQEAQEAEAARLAEQARIEAEAAAAAKAAQEARAKADAAQAAEAQAEADQQRQAEEAAREAEAAAQAAEAAQKRQAEEAAEAARTAEAEAAEQAEREAQAARDRDAEAAKAVEPLRTTITPVAPMLDAEPEAAAPKRGILGRLMGRGGDAPVVRRVLDDAMLEQLEELLIAADMGVDTALRVTANMAEGRLGKKLSVNEIKTLMSDEIARIMEPVAKPLPIYAKKPQVVLVVGVNGSGKTTTIGKLASQFRAAGKKVVIAAGDTFRAAAVEQLQVWGERAGVPVLTAPQGSDPASLAFDAMVKAEADGADLLMIDTAGRLQNRGDLMEELAKIVRVIRKKDPDAPHNTLLVLDATTGQNAVNQVKVFQEISDVSGLVMTKLDGTAKGGVLVALADKFGLPIHAIGVGEQIDDLQAFDPQEFADALTGLDR